MKLRKIAGDDCADGRTCPAVLESDRQTFVIVGTVVTDPDAVAQLAIGPGETVVEVPISLLSEIAHAR